MQSSPSQSSLALNGSLLKAIFILFQMKSCLICLGVQRMNTAPEMMYAPGLLSLERVEGSGRVLENMNDLGDFLIYLNK